MNIYIYLNIKQEICFIIREEIEIVFIIYAIDNSGYVLAWAITVDRPTCGSIMIQNETYLTRNFDV